MSEPSTGPPGENNPSTDPLAFAFDASTRAALQDLMGQKVALALSAQQEAEPMAPQEQEEDRDPTPPLTRQLRELQGPEVLTRSPICLRKRPPRATKIPLPPTRTAKAAGKRRATQRTPSPTKKKTKKKTTSGEELSRSSSPSAGTIATAAPRSPLVSESPPASDLSTQSGSGPRPSSTSEISDSGAGRQSGERVRQPASTPLQHIRALSTTSSRRPLYSSLLSRPYRKTSEGRSLRYLTGSQTSRSPSTESTSW